MAKLTSSLSDVGSEGGCLCGAVRFRVTSAPLAVSRCHCRACRRAVGSAGVTWTIFKREDFLLLRGQPTRYRFSEQATRTFCSVCGTSLSYEPSTAAGQIELTTASFDEPERFSPTREVWLDHRIAWEPLDPSLVHFSRGSTENGASDA
jgi:hypothetical protein